MFRVPLASTGLRQKDINAVAAVLSSGRLTMGEKVKIFEKQMASYLGVRFFVMVNSGSSANLLILESLLRPTSRSPLLSPGDGVIVPAIAWPTTVWPIIQLGLNPIFVDIEPSTIGLSVEAADELLSKTKIPAKAVFPIHPIGLALDQDQLTVLTQKHDLIEISDVCESLGARFNGHHAGSQSLAFSVSFYFSHHMTTMEGGGIATNDSLLADDLRSMRSHGWSRDRSDAREWEGQVSDNDSRFLFVSTGFNVRPMEIQAAIGISQLEDLPAFINRRQQIAHLVQESLVGENLELIGYDAFSQNSSRHSWMLLPFRVKGDNVAKKKSEILNLLKLRGIETRPILTGNFLAQPAIQRISRQRVVASSFPNATAVAESSFMLSCHHDLSDEQIGVLQTALERASNL
jgi:CDP-6-deoxy-D-xylo-4-hexulose-3-dehydrase